MKTAFTVVPHCYCDVLTLLVLVAFYVLTCGWLLRTFSFSFTWVLLPVVLYHNATNSYFLFQALLFYFFIISFEQEYGHQQKHTSVLFYADAKFCLLDIDIYYNKQMDHTRSTKYLQSR